MSELSQLVKARLSMKGPLDDEAIRLIAALVVDVADRIEAGAGEMTDSQRIARASADQMIRHLQRS